MINVVILGGHGDGLVAAGVDVRLLGPMPTPAVSYLTRTFRAEAGIVISARMMVSDHSNKELTIGLGIGIITQTLAYFWVG